VNFPNHGKKATQAVARLIEKSGGPIDYLRVSKLIYLADRASIIKRGVPIVGGQYFSMRQGPVISEVMNFVNRQNAPGWKSTISARYGHELRLLCPPSSGALSESELAILDCVVAEHSKRTTEELVQWCHENCPEYERVTGSSRRPIAVESILKAVGKTQRQIKKLVDEALDVQELDRMLA
jgi:uncharacterized phage-associated protein